MAATSARRLTKLSFRRDVRLFLGALVGFLAVLVVLLLLLLQSFLGHTSDAVRQGWDNAARLAVAELSRGPDIRAADLQLSVIRSRYAIAGATLTTRDGRQIHSGVREQSDKVEALVRPTPVGTLTLYFDNSRLVASRRIFQLTALISVLAVACGVTLLALYLPRITGPIEQMLDSAAEISERGPDVDEQQYLIETFRASIDTLRTQQQELQQLHDAQKVRADDLERVTAALTRSLTSGFLAVDPRGRVVDLNLAAREILRAGDVAGAPLDDAFGDSAFTRSILDAVENRQAMTRSEVTFAREGAPPQLIGLTTVPLLDAGQQFLGLLALFTDLTPFRELETRVRDLQSLADLGEISAGIAHEFRNALSTILGYLKLARRAASMEDAERAIEKAEREASLLSSAVDRLLAFARPMRIEWQPIELLQLARDVCERVPAEEVSLVCGGDSAEIEGDPSLLGRAIENLVRNAVDAVREKGSGGVRVSVRRDGTAPRLLVEDDGVGLDPDDVPRLLLPFQSAKPGGYGLGLALTRKIVLLHGGTLRLTGRPGAGATATIEFPSDVGRASARLSD